MSRNGFIGHFFSKSASELKLDFDDEALISLAKETDSCFGAKKEMNDDVRAVIEGRSGMDIYSDNDKSLETPMMKEERRQDWLRLNPSF